MSKKRVIIVAGLLVIAGLAIAGSYTGFFKGVVKTDNLPEAKEEFRKLYEHYTTAGTALHIAGEINLYDGENRKVVKEKNTYRVIKKGDQFYSQLAYLQTFCNGKTLVQLDTMNQLIIVSKFDPDAMASAGSPQASIDMLFSDTAAFKITGSVTGNDKERTLSFTSDFNPEVRTYSVHYDPAAYRVQRATIEWWKDALVTDTTKTDRVWITHIDYKYLPLEDLHIDDTIKDIIEVTEDGIKPAARYKNFALHNLTPEL